MVFSRQPTDRNAGASNVTADRARCVTLRDASKVSSRQRAYTVVADYNAANEPNFRDNAAGADRAEQPDTDAGGPVYNQPVNSLALAE